MPIALNGHMKARFENDGGQVEADTRELSALGTFVVTDQARSDGPLELLLGDEQASVRVQGQVVAVTADGFAVAFDGLTPQVLDQLTRLLDPDAAEPPPAEPAETDSGMSMPVQGEDWSPPVTEPVLHEYRPETDFVQPPPGI